MPIAAKPNAPLPLQSVFLAYAFALLLMQNAEDALAVAETIGFPVMIKVKRSGRGGRDGGQRWGAKETGARMFRLFTCCSAESLAVLVALVVPGE